MDQRTPELVRREFGQRAPVFLWSRTKEEKDKVRR